MLRSSTRVVSTLTRTIVPRQYVSVFIPLKTEQTRSFVQTFKQLQQTQPQQEEKLVIPAKQPSQPTETVFVDSEGTFDKDTGEVEVPLLLRLWKEYFVRYTIIAVASLTILWVLYDVTDWFSSMTIKGTAKWMFSTGFISGIVFAAGATRLKQYFTIRSTPVYTAALRKILAEPKITSRMAIPLRPGKFRAYAYEYPDMKNNLDVPWTRKIQFWRPPRMQMMFQLQDKNGQVADVNCEVSKRPGKKNILSDRFKFHHLSVELPDSEVIYIRGDKTAAEYNPGKAKFCLSQHVCLEQQYKASPIRHPPQIEDH